MKARPYDANEVGELWKGVLLNQFHDIIPGSSIGEVYQEARALHADILKKAEDMAAKERDHLICGRANMKRSCPEVIAVFNSLSWRRNAVVKVPCDTLYTEDGVAVPIQKAEDGNWALVRDIPSCGWKILYPAAKAPMAAAKASKATKAEPLKLAAAVKANARCLENDVVIYKFNDVGEVVSAVLKADGQEMMAAPGNAFRMYKDVPSSFDAWDIDSQYKLTPFELEQKAMVTVIPGGPAFGGLKVRRKLNQSTLTQEIILKAGSPVLTFHTVVDWQESHKMLKVNFPVKVVSEDALHEIQFGHLRRPTHATRPYDAQRFEVCNHKWTALLEERRGAAILNDCKYGINVEKNSMNLTLLRSPLAPDWTADKGTQEFTYAFTFWDAPFGTANPIHDAYELNVPAVVQHRKQGSGGDGELLCIDNDGIVLETMKLAEDGSNDVIIRLYESLRSASTCTVDVAGDFSEAVPCDMLERKLTGTEGKAMPIRDGKFSLTFRPFEIKTLRLSGSR